MGIYVEKFFQSLDVSIVLPEWVCKAVFVSIDIFSPFTAIFVSGYPATVVLCLNNKNTKSRDNNMIDLRSARVCR